MELTAKRGREATVTNYNLITIILIWCGFAVVSSLYVTIPMVSIFVKEFEITTAQAAWSSSAFSFTYATSFLFFGPLSDRYGRKQMMFWGLVALFIVSPLLAFVTDFSWLVALRAIQGIAAATFAPAVLAYIVEIYPAERRVTAIGFVSSGFLMSGIAGQVLSSWVSQNLGWPYVFSFLAGAYFLSSFLVGWLLPRGERQEHISVVLALKQMGAILSRKSLLVCYFIAATLLLSFVGMYTALGSYLSQSPFDLSSSQILLVRAAGIFGMCLSPFVGHFVKKLGTKTVLQAGLVSSVLGLCIVGVSSSLALLIFMSVLFVAGISITVPALISLVGELAVESRGIAVSLYTFILFIGATLGPIITLCFLKTGSYTLTFESLSISLGIGFLFSFLIRKPK
ncbi:MFS transporter [Aneurinibacillus tyrosinisolvens]|uniref:MFS transporter n=1 Tax=Aneurinibacillus tyrosinisolvens TaxID=1443435 RepID=UPI00063F9DF2|nr:MFS transporter [Aneurinibacillus tyrosinisolvens]